MNRRQPNRLLNIAMSVILVVGLLPSQAFAEAASTTGAAATDVPAAATEASAETTSESADTSSSNEATSSEAPAKTEDAEADATTPSTPAPSASTTPDTAAPAPKESGTFKLVDVADITGSSVKVGDTQVADGTQLASGDVVSIHVEYTIGADKREVVAGDEFTYELPDCLDYSADENSGTLKDGDTAVGTFSISGHTLKLHYDAAHAGDVASWVSVSGTIGGAGDKTLDFPGIGSYDVTVKGGDASDDSATDTKTDGDSTDTGDSEDGSEEASKDGKGSLLDTLGLFDASDSAANKIGGIFSSVTMQGNPVPITSGNTSITLELFTDSSCTAPIGSVDRDQTLFGSMAITYTILPTASDNVRTYTMPAGVSLTGSAAGTASGTLFDSEGTTAIGTWSTNENTVTFAYDAAWLANNASEVTTNFKFAFALDSSGTSGMASQRYAFPATPAPVEITFNDDKVVASEGQAVESDGSADSNEASHEVTVEKVDLQTSTAGTKLAGAEFEVVSTTQGISYDQTFTTNADGTVTLKDAAASVKGLSLLAGAYSLKETKPPTGYTALADMTFAVDSNGIVSTSATGLSASGSGLSVADAPIKTSLKVTSVWDDSDNAARKRPDQVAVHLLRDGKTVATDYPSSANSWTVQFSDLPTYIDGKAVEYTVSEDAVALYSNAITHDGTVWTVTNTLDTHGVAIEKVSSTSVTTQLVGASLQILDSAGEVIDSWNTNGMAHAAKLPAGSYALHEDSAPAGYSTAEDIAFEVESDGTVSSDGAALSAATVVMEDAPEPYTPTGFTPLASRLYPTLASAALLTARTGDQTSPVLPICLGVTGLAIVAGALYLRKRHKGE